MDYCCGSVHLPVVLQKYSYLLNETKVVHPHGALAQISPNTLCNSMRLEGKVV